MRVRAILSLIARPCGSLRVSVRPSIRVISAGPGTPAVPPAARGVRSRCGACEQDCPWSVCGSWDGVAVRAAAARPGRRSKLRDPWLRVDSARPLLDPWMLMLRTLGRRYIRRLFTRLRLFGIAFSFRLSSAPKGRAAFNCTCSQLLQPISRQYFPVDRIAPRRGALQTAVGEATEGSHSNLCINVREQLILQAPAVWQVRAVYAQQQ